jgi:hypothetical protein
MRLRSRRRDLVVWSLWPRPAEGHGGRWLTRPARTRRIRRSLRLGALITLVGVMWLARGTRDRWRPLLAGVALTTTGVILRGGALGAIIMPGLWFLIYALLIPAGSDADRKRRSELRRELAGYSTAAHRCDLVATLDRYPDEVTYELRDVLAEVAMTAPRGGIPGSRRC